MEGRYTQQDIDQFFSQFKKLSMSYELIKVHQLINNPNAKAKHLVKFNHKPFKLIIMTGTLILAISAIILWLTPEDSNKTFNKTKKSPISIEYSKQEEKIENHNSVVKEENSKSVKPKTSLLAEDNSVNESNDITESKVLTNDEAEKNELICQSCDWPKDTILDKKELFIYLSDSELEKLGIYKNDTSGYFKTNYKHSNTWVYNKGDIVFKNKVNSNKFGLTFITDTSLTEPSLSLFRSYDGFYFAMDTLVPILITFKNGLKPEILWFSSTEDLFRQLPTRYKHLQKTYSCIKEIKKSQKHKQVVNYRNFDSIKNDLIKIPIIELNDDELKNWIFRTILTP